VKKMFAKIEEDADFQKKYAVVMKVHINETEKALADKLIELGKISGFEFSKDDLIEARREFFDSSNSSEELSESDLNKVAGGGEMKTQGIVLSIFSAGIICAIISVANAKTVCAASLTTANEECKKY